MDVGFERRVHSLRRLAKVDLKKTEIKIEKQRRQFINDIDRKKSKVLKHFKEITRDTSCPHVDDLVRQVELKSAAGGHIQPSFHTIGTPASNINTEVEETVQDDASSETEEERLRQLKKQLTALLNTGLINSKVSKTNAVQGEFHATSTRDSPSTSQTRRSELQICSTSVMLQKKTHPLLAKPVASIPHNLRIDPSNFGTIVHEFWGHVSEVDAADNMTESSHSSDGSMCPSEKSSEISVTSISKSDVRRKTPTMVGAGSESKSREIKALEQNNKQIVPAPNKWRL